MDQIDEGHGGDIYVVVAGDTQQSAIRETLADRSYLGSDQTTKDDCEAVIHGVWAVMQALTTESREKRQNGRGK